MGAALISLLLLADANDQAFLLKRLDGLATRYEEHARQQSATSLRIRAAVLREITHLPLRDGARQEAGKLLARIVQEDRSYRIRAEAARAIGRVGTVPALRAMYRSLFGADGRTRKFELLHAVLPDALSRLHNADDMEWISVRILQSAATRTRGTLFKQAGPLADSMVVLTLEGIGRARARALGPETVALAGGGVPAIRAAALRTLIRLDVADPIIGKSLDAESVVVRAAAAAYPRLLRPQVEKALADPAPLVRRAAIRGVRGRDARTAIPLFIARLRAEKVAAVRLDLLDALNDLTGREFGDDAGLWAGWWAANEDTFAGAEAHDGSGRVYFFDLGLRTERVVFVIDVSASMSREDEQRVSRLEYAARQLGNAVQKLRPTARFSVLAFAAEIRRFPGKGKEMGDRTDGVAATRWLRSLKPAGSTNTYGALMHGLDDPIQPDTLVLLSDGNPYRCLFKGKTYSEHEQILAEVRRVNAGREVRIHTVALVSGVYAENDAEDAASAAEFLRRLAAQNSGDFREVR